MLPASRLNAQGQPVIDLWAILKIAFPLFVQAGLQAALNLIDTWFVGRISVDALAGGGGVFWLVLG
ncbi:MAG: MATE family efflux transporter, partial [Burkholderiaceae bacterium]